MCYLGTSAAKQLFVSNTSSKRSSSPTLQPAKRSRTSVSVLSVLEQRWRRFLKNRCAKKLFSVLIPPKIHSHLLFLCNLLYYTRLKLALTTPVHMLFHRLRTLLRTLLYHAIYNITFSRVRTNKNSVIKILCIKVLSFYVLSRSKWSCQPILHALMCNTALKCLFPSVHAAALACSLLAGGEFFNDWWVVQ